jgi:protein arginine N-methyltransferase 1
MVQDDRVYYRLRTHLEMLNDEARCLAYKKALERVVRDKIVLDVGCGSGILSLFAAKTGAKQVLAVDMDIPPGAEETAKINGLGDSIQFFKGKIQDMELPVESVDVIVSEWMGGLLLMEDMLPAVLYARDRWLKPGGVLLPDGARLFLVPLDNVAGIDENRFPGLRETIASQMWVSVINPSRFAAEPACILNLDLYKAQKYDIATFASRFRFVLNKAGKLNGFGLWFDVLFNSTVPPVELSTAPWLPPTHWAQGLWILPKDIEVKQGEEVSGIFSQTAIAPSTASYRARVQWENSAGGTVSFAQSIEASPSNMNTPGKDEDDIAEQAMAGAYSGRNCFWIGCRMSFGVLMAARYGAKQVSILNHSRWAEEAMRRMAEQEGLNNVRFFTAVPDRSEIADKDLCLLGSADSSWRALVSFIKVSRMLDRSWFPVRFFDGGNPWRRFHGFDFSSFAAYDLEMYHEDEGFAGGMVFRDITGEESPEGVGPEEKEMIYRGIYEGSIDLSGGSYNCLQVGFGSGSVVLPLPGLVEIRSSGKELQTIRIEISVIQLSACRFELALSGSGWSLAQDYEQPLTSMGHIVRNR